MRRPRIAVVGNMNMDAVVRVNAFPRAGENRLGSSLDFLEGGKGANQARAVARLGGQVSLVGRVGKDSFGDALRKNLRTEGVDIRYVTIDPKVRTGMAFVFVENGENRILSVLGANEAVTPRHIHAARRIFAEARLLLVQLGIPTPAVDALITLARKLGVPVLLDPTPIRRQLPRHWKDVDVLLPNESELGHIVGARGKGESQRPMLRRLFRLSRARMVIVKLGARGCLLATREGIIRRIPPFPVHVVDPTGSGDAFSAAFGVASASGASVEAAARFACAAGALAATKLGAAPSLPTLRDIRRRFPSAVPAVMHTL